MLANQLLHHFVVPFLANRCEAGWENHDVVVFHADAVEELAEHNHREQIGTQQQNLNLFLMFDIE